jgi:hypothetical protein
MHREAEAELDSSAALRATAQLEGYGRAASRTTATTQRRFDPVMTPEERDRRYRERWCDAGSAQGVCFQHESDPRVENTRTLDLEEAPGESASHVLPDAVTVFNTDPAALSWRHRPRANSAILLVASALLVRPGGVTTRELAHAAGVTRPTARKWLDHLVDTGRARREGLKTTRRYFRPGGGA